LSGHAVHNNISPDHPLFFLFKPKSEIGQAAQGVKNASLSKNLIQKGQRRSKDR